MKLYSTGIKTSQGIHRIHVQPGPATQNSEFFDKEGNPITYTFEFINGECKEVPANIARYMVNKGMASKSPIIVDA